LLLGTLEEINTSATGQRAQLVSAMCLGGRFDPSLFPRLPIDLWADGHPRWELPATGAVALCVVRIRDSNDQAVYGELVPDKCTFMPDESPLVILKSAADPRVLETVKKLQEARAKTLIAPATRPAGKE
jgi:hypothetical protein